MSAAGAGDLAGRIAPEQAEALIASSDDAILSKDVDGIITSWNPGAERLYGYTADEAVGESIRILIPPHREGEERLILDRVIRGERVEHYETERVRKDGTQVVVSLSVSPIRGPSGTPEGAAVIARNITEQQRALERAERLQRVTSALSHAVSTDQVAAILVEEVTPALAADAAAVALLEADAASLTIVARHGFTEAELEPWSALPAASEVPLAAALRIGEPAWYSSADEVRAQYPDLSDIEMRFEALAVLPLVVEDTPLGSVVFSFTAQRGFGPEERAFMLATVQQAANALARAALHDAERQAREQLAFIARASEILGESLELDETLERLAAVAVPKVCDWCAVDLVDETGLRNVVVAHVDPAKVQLARELRERYPSDPDAQTGVPHVIRTGEPELYPEIPDEVLAQSAQSEEHLRAMRELAISSAMVVPLKAHGDALGAITFIAAESRQRYTSEDLAFASELASHAALAIDNARRYRKEHEAALTLQRALLPPRLPEVAGVELAARYLPAGVGVEAGGDWYDVIELERKLLLVIGDVSGRGIPAASIMGRLRTAIGAYALEGHGVTTIASRVDRLLRSFDEREMATMMLVCLDLDSGGLNFVRAGHPPALVRDPGGAVEELSGRGSPPLGVLPDIAIEDNSAQLEPGATLLLYTDGLVERRDAPIDQGIDWLKQRLSGAPADLEATLDDVVGELEAAPVGDDIAVLAVRFGTAAETSGAAG